MLKRTPQARRVEQVRLRLERARLDALVVTSLSNIRYLTGFSGSHAVALLTPDSFFLFTDGRYGAQVRSEVIGAQSIIVRETVWQTLGQSGYALHARRIGIEAQHCTVASMNILRKTLPGRRWVPTAGLVEAVATVKDDSEIEHIRRAVTITDKVFKKLLATIKPGISELDVAAEISYWHRRYGAEADAFEPIVASGIRGAFPHARASAKIIRKGELVTLDFGCRIEGYHSDMTRTIALGAPSVKAKRIYQTVLEAQKRAVDSAREGVPGRALDFISRQSLKRAGLAKYFTHSLGHGLGLQVHELPRLSRLSKDVLQERNIVTIEPGIYIPGFGGIRIEDDLLIHKGHGEVLNRSSKELLVL